MSRLSPRIPSTSRRYEVEKAGIGITVKKDVNVGGLMFADDFVGLTTNAEDLQTLINVVQGFCVINRG